MGVSQSIIPIVNWSEYEVLYKLEYFMSHNHLSDMMKFSLDEIELLNRIMGGFTKLDLIFKAINSRDAIWNALTTWEQQHAYVRLDISTISYTDTETNLSQSSYASMTYDQIVKELITDSDTSIIDNVFYDAACVQKFERWAHLDRMTGCLGSMRIAWSLTHFSKTTSAKHWSDKRILEKSIQYAPDPRMIENDFVMFIYALSCGHFIEPKIDISTNDLVKYMANSKHDITDYYQYVIKEYTYYDSLVNYILKRDDVTYQNLLDMLTKMIIKAEFCESFMREDVSPDVIKRVINHPLFIQRLRDDAIQNILQIIQIRQRIFFLSENPFQLLSFVTLDYLDLELEKEYIDYILEQEFPVETLVDTLSIYTKNFPWYNYQGYSKKRDKYEYFVKSLLHRPQIQVVHLESLLISACEELDELNYWFQNSLMEHSLVHEVDPNLIVLRCFKDQMFKIEDFIYDSRITRETINKLLEYEDFNRCINVIIAVLRSSLVDHNIAYNFFIHVCNVSNESRKKLSLNSKQRQLILNALLPHLTYNLIENEINMLKENNFWRKTLERHLGHM